MESHLLSGTYRPDRHGPRTPAPAPPATLPFNWKPNEKDLAALSPQARAFIADAQRTHEFNFFGGRVLMEAASTLDLLTACWQSINADGVMLTGPRGAVRPNPMVKEHRRHAEWLLRAMKALRLETP